MQWEGTQTHPGQTRASCFCRPQTSAMRSFQSRKKEGFIMGAALSMEIARWLNREALFLRARTQSLCNRAAAAAAPLGRRRCTATPKHRNRAASQLQQEPHPGVSGQRRWGRHFGTFTKIEHLRFRNEEFCFLATQNEQKITANLSMTSD